VSSEALIVAGGANITGDKWSEPLTKKWYDSAFVLEKPEGVWKTGFKLPRPLGYGVSITAEDSVWCFGGSDATRHYTDCFRLQWHQGELRTLPLPPMPRACANACGALVGRMIYIAGGIETPASTEALHSFWSLDLDAPEPIWHELDAWPGPGRMLATAGAYDGSFYLFSGAALSAGPDGKPVREYLRDAYRFTPGVGWKRLADLPRAAVAAPSPSPMVHALGTPSLLVISGDDGLNVTFQPVEKHPGFPLGSLRYDPVHDAWTAYAFPEISRATAPTVSWQNQIIIPNGEVRPRVRTPEVLGFVFPEAK
jgi:N-acetylneuraminic acid mutarotase